MHNHLPYNRLDHGDFMENWQPHQGASDIWKIQGIIRESLIPDAVYSYRLSVYKIAYPMESFYAIQYTLGDILRASGYSERIIVPQVIKKNKFVDFDSESLFCGDSVQILDTEKALVVRLRGNEFGMDLRLDKDLDPVWFGEGGKLQLSGGKHSPFSMFVGVMPRMDTFGRLLLQGQDMRVEGVSSIEHSWGSIPVKRAKLHWEKFYLFFDDGDEVSIVDMPLISKKEGTYVDPAGTAVELNDFVFEPIEFMEIDEWRFSSKWQLDIPQLDKGPFYLMPLIPNQFSLPICRPLVGIYDKEGKCYGYGHGELMPGARNELSRIGLRHYKHTYK